MRANKRPRSSDHAARRRALADATAGVIGSLASVLAFYPVDVWKTSLQAGVTDGATANAKEECFEENYAPNPKLGNEGSQVLRPKSLRLPSSSSHLSKVPPFSRLFRGLPHKIIHTIVSSFTYFFVYSLVQTKYAAHRQQSVLTHSGNASSSGTTSTATKLLLTAFAAVINTGITLPLDTISSRKQAGTTTSTTSTASSSGKVKDKQVKPILKEGELGVKKGGNIGKANKNGPTSYYMPSYEDITNNGDTAPSLETSDDNSASETNNDGYMNISARDSSSEEYHSANEEYEEDALEGEQNIECTPQNNEQDVKKEDASNNDDSIALKQNTATPATATSNNTTKNRRGLYIKSPEKYKFSFSTNLAQEAFATTSRGSSSSFGNLVDNSYNNNSSSDNNRVENMSTQKRHHELKSLWNGLFPALLLCTNPAIQYTMYDTLKNALFQHRMTLLASMKRKEGGTTTTGGGSSEGESTSQSNILSNNKLTMWEAFVFGLISKFFATIITYPLIRCKVLLMVSSPEAFLGGGSGEGGEEDGGDDLRRKNVLDGQSNDAAVNNGHGNKKSSKIPSENTPPPSTSASRNNDNNQKRYPRSLLLLLIHIFKNDGVRGIYKGCSLQLLHTILKSALLMMVREKITFATHQFFQVDN